MTRGIFPPTDAQGDTQRPLEFFRGTAASTSEGFGFSPQYQSLGMARQLAALAFLCLPALGTTDNFELSCFIVEFGYFI